MDKGDSRSRSTPAAARPPRTSRSGWSVLSSSSREVTTARLRVVAMRRASSTTRSSVASSAHCRSSMTSSVGRERSSSRSTGSTSCTGAPRRTASRQRPDGVRREVRERAERSGGEEALAPAHPHREHRRRRRPARRPRSCRRRPLRSAGPVGRLRRRPPPDPPEGGPADPPAPARALGAPPAHAGAHSSRDATRVPHSQPVRAPDATTPGSTDGAPGRRGRQTRGRQVMVTLTRFE